MRLLRGGAGYRHEPKIAPKRTFSAISLRINFKRLRISRSRRPDFPQSSFALFLGGNFAQARHRIATDMRRYRSPVRGAGILERRLGWCLNFLYQGPQLLAGFE